MKKGLIIPLASVFAVTSFAGTASADHEGLEFMVDLTPEAETMDVESEATGEAYFEVSEDGDSIMYSVHVDDLDNAMAGHLHSGAEGEDGPIELFLFDNDEPMDVNGNAASGTLTEEDLVGDMTWEEFSMSLVAGDVYANLHTEEYPEGEIRGQLDEEAQEDVMMPEAMPQTGLGGASDGGAMTGLWAGIAALAVGGTALMMRRKNEA